ncbi:unnamed protein product (macronuclear) [Paramecium tetraurelia]|uniref:Uncharacterized protein n=1 Tax=Paramecium tetraurelia TaxID=5888 RepID=A0CUW5_PARTE|nr:uncharacterized protein GSPATT00039038001 [Paramecium tetraurelia]CAK74582.1 unnamed protein product [Paramecium tetraurelia]|eukprot:XP_001441979.1 hypothetical protein (macronuclear) [Paramecium tetraurelia strain d4-2]
MSKKQKLLTGLNSLSIWLINTPDWLKENQKDTIEDAQQQIEFYTLELDNHKEKFADNNHGMQSNPKSMKPKPMQELSNKKLLTDSKSTSERSYPLNRSPSEIDLIIKYFNKLLDNI